MCCGMLTFFAYGRRCCRSYDGDEESPDLTVGLIRHQPTSPFLELHAPNRSVPLKELRFVWSFASAMIPTGGIVWKGRTSV